jgi:hypothetical protein
MWAQALGGATYDHEFAAHTASGCDSGLERLLGVGTETFEQGSHITSVRIAIGSRRDL